jgi:hypothetical protein
MRTVSTRLLPRGRKTRWNAAVVVAAISISIQVIAAALGSTPALASTFPLRGSQSPVEESAHVEVPSGDHPCPNSGLGASCSYGAEITPDKGVAGLPDGLVACASDETKPTFGALGACSAPSAPPELAVTSQAAPLRPTTPRIELSTDKTLLAAGDPVQLSVSTSISATGSPWSVEVFDQTTQTLVGACARSTNCQVVFTAKGGTHTFIAYLALPSSTIPVDGIRLQSGTVDVQWLSVTLAASDPSVVGPGRAVTFTATASTEVGKIGYQIELSDTTAGHLLTYCTEGTTCSTSLIEPEPGTHAVVAGLVQAPGLQHVQEQSAPVSATWLGVVLTASAYSVQGGTTALVATANTDLTNTPWAIFIFMSPGRVVGHPCAAATCTASVALPAAGTPSFYAVVAGRGSVVKASGDVSLVLGQASSTLVTPIRMLWGVDSCASFTQDAAGTTGLLPQVTARLGTPDFWGRYLPNTGNCAALSPTEIAAAHSRHMGILPIYNDYDCSAVSGGAAGSAYAAAAVQIALADQIPLGTGIAIDIEPPGDACPGAANVDVGFITAWYDGITAAGYAPVYYGNTTAGSEFGRAWCGVVAQRPEIATTSFLWTFEPDYVGGFKRATAPGYGPNYAGCAGQYDAWQYRIGDGSAPDVDHDEATNRLPIWYP